MKNFAIIGSGSWGSALGIYLANNGNNVKMWSFNEEERDVINNDKVQTLFYMLHHQSLQERLFKNTKNMLKIINMLLYVQKDLKLQHATL